MRATLLVAVGSIVGATARALVGELLGGQPGAFPWATLIVNLAGCALAGLALRTLARSSERWLALVTGTLGGLTTMSAFAVETRSLLAADRMLVAAVYVVGSVAGGVVALEVARSARAAR